MSPANYLPRTDYQRIKAACRDLVHAAGGQSRAADIARVGQQHISRCVSASAENETLFLPLDVVIDLEAHAADPVVTREMAQLAGHILVPAPDVARCGIKLGLITAKALKEVGEAFATLGGYLDDGTICKAEGAHVAREIDEAILMLTRLKLQVLEDARQRVGE
ncbi:MAG: phage regulatory CII family protein [Devosia sp.]